MITNLMFEVFCIPFILEMLGILFLFCIAYISYHKIKEWHYKIKHKVNEDIDVELERSIYYSNKVRSALRYFLKENIKEIKLKNRR